MQRSKIPRWGRTAFYTSALIILGALFTFGSISATAAAPKLISFQGILKTAGGTPVANGSYSVTFKIYDAAAAGNVLWTETQSVTTTSGIFTVLLGGGGTPVPDSAFNDTTRYLGITVAPDPEMTPRQQLVSVPYDLNGWSTTGNGNTNPGRNFLGTADNQAFELKVNGSRALRIEPNATSPNLIGGQSANSVTSGVHGATISGGGTSIGSNTNRVTDDFGTVGGGQSNRAGDNFGTTNDNGGATVGGGAGNAASGLISTVGGGESNTASGAGAAVSGGVANTASGQIATVGGGRENIASNDFATVGGGLIDTASGEYATVGGGRQNTASGQYATVAGGNSNRAIGTSATVGGGLSNYAAGGTVGGGLQNAASIDYSTVAGGYKNAASANSAAVGGGAFDTASGNSSTVGGGNSNIASGSVATVSGGVSNTAGGIGASVGGGGGNIASGSDATVGGGVYDTASGVASTVPGGLGNKASGGFSFAAGRRAKANHLGTFVWADSSADADFASTAANQFLIRAAGGVGIGTNSPTKKLEVAGSIKVGASDTVFSSNLSSNSPMSIQAPAGTTRVFINDVNGRVGIGTNAPEGALHVFDGSAGSVTANANAGLILEHNTDTWIHILSPDASQRGILFGSPANALMGSIRFNPPGVEKGYNFRGGNNLVRLTLDSLGNLTVPGCVVGSNITCPSDARFKRNITPIEGALDAVGKLRGVHYEWKRDEFPEREFAEGQQVGLIAQEVQQVVPQAVIKQSDGYLSVDYSRLVPLLIEGMKEQQKRIVALEAKDDELQALVQKLALQNPQGVTTAQVERAHTTQPK